MSVRINLNQARELLEFFGGEDADMTVGRCGPEAHSGEGLYVWCTEHPEEGSMKLDEAPAADVPTNDLCSAPDCDCEPGIECQGRAAARGVQGIGRQAIPPSDADEPQEGAK